LEIIEDSRNGSGIEMSERALTENLGIDGPITCAKCHREYLPKDFTLIL
jgi:hypothetical protein